MNMTSFHERQKNLFEHLKVAEDKCGFSRTNKLTDTPDYGAIDKFTYKKLKREMKQFRGRESIYKRQEANIKECLRAKTIPDYIKNPQKWNYYSLSDVTPEQMSDSTNTATAIAFIQEMEERSQDSIKMETDTDDTGAVFKKPIFNFSRAVKKEPEVKDEKAVFKSNKIIMPEYVVGVSKRKEKKERLVKREPKDSQDTVTKVELKLNHLYDDEDED